MAAAVSIPGRYKSADNVSREEHDSTENHSYSVLPNCRVVMGQDTLVNLVAQIFAWLQLIPGSRPWDLVLFDGLRYLHVHRTIDLGTILEIAGIRQ